MARFIVDFWMDGYDIDEEMEASVGDAIYELLDSCGTSVRVQSYEGWISVADRLPAIDEYVIWRYACGNIFQECIDKDWDKEYLDYFLSGYGLKEISGPITHWMRIPRLDEE